MALLRITCLMLFGLLLVTPLVVSANDVTVDESDGDDDDSMSVDDEEEEEENVVISDENEDVTQTGDTPADDTEEEEEEEEEELYKTSPDAKSTILFTNRPNTNFAAGQVVKSLIGFTNKGQNDFIVSAIEASFRYPEDFSYFIQNFSKIYYETYVPPGAEVSFVYDFIPSETLYSRPFGMVVNIYYKNEEGVEFRDAVFNGTVKIVEVEEQFDAESFFMYVLMISGLCLLMFIVHYVWTTFKRGGRTTFKKPQVKIERGTQSKKKNQVDESWLPEGTISKPSPRKHTSPRNKKKGKTPDVD